MKNNKFFWGSSYDRGLDVVLFLWPDIVEKDPDAELHICYGWDLYYKAHNGNPERMEWMERINSLMKQEGIIHYGRVGKRELSRIRKLCGIWLYPTYFTEIFCITAIEVQSDGIVPVVTNLAALKETVGSGFKIDGDIKEIETVEKIKEAVLKLLENPDLWEIESEKAKKFSKDYLYNNLSKQWTGEFEVPTTNPKVTIYTPTVREGWFRLMSENIHDQTYQNIEWIIVDDYKQSRLEIANRYAKAYELDIKYLRGKKRKTKRTYSLINANNTAIEAASGELFVFLQDFVLMEKDAIERLVDIYRHNPRSLIAPVDKYNRPSVKPDITNKEDWFNGLHWEDVSGEFMRENVRQEHIGLRESFIITDFEQNFGAVPLKILKDLGGYYEFLDEALGFDDTEILYRAKELGYNLLIDDSIVATCIDHMETLGKDEGGTSVNRHRRLNDPRYVWMLEQIESGKLPVVRTQEIDDGIELFYDIPEEIDDDHAVEWMKKNIKKIVDKWGDL